MKKKLFLFCLCCIFLNSIKAQEIFEAIRRGDLNLIKELTEKQPGLVNETRANPFTPLLFAINNQKWEIAEYLIQAGADVNAVLLEDYYGDTPISIAIRKGNLEMVKLLSEKGADIHYRTKLGENYLHFAAAMDEVEIAEYLIGCGIDIYAPKAGAHSCINLSLLMVFTTLRFLWKNI